MNYWATDLAESKYMWPNVPLVYTSADSLEKKTNK